MISVHRQKSRRKQPHRHQRSRWALIPTLTKNQRRRKLPPKLHQSSRRWAQTRIRTNRKSLLPRQPLRKLHRKQQHPRGQTQIRTNPGNLPQRRRHHHRRPQPKQHPPKDPIPIPTQDPKHRLQHPRKPHLHRRRRNLQIQTQIRTNLENHLRRPRHLHRRHQPKQHLQKDPTPIRMSRCPFRRRRHRHRRKLHLHHQRKQWILDLTRTKFKSLHPKGLHQKQFQSHPSKEDQTRTATVPLHRKLHPHHRRRHHHHLPKNLLALTVMNQPNQLLVLLLPCLVHRCHLHTNPQLPTAIAMVVCRIQQLNVPNPKSVANSPACRHHQAPCRNLP
eukprot:PhF_6_TR31546/c0_g1_i1/m.46566